MRTPSRIVPRVGATWLLFVLAAGCQSVALVSDFREPQITTAPSKSPPIVTVSYHETREPQERSEPSGDAVYSPLIVPPGDLKPLTSVAPSPREHFSLQSDLPEFLPTLWDDTLALATWKNAVVLGVAGGSAVALRQSGLDEEVRDDTLHHEDRWGGGDIALRQFGDFTYQVPLLAGLYGYSLWQQDAGLHDYSQALVNGYTLNVVSTLAIKGLANTERPTANFSWGHYGFPSYHTSSLFTIGGVTEEYYGWQASLPIYVLGGLVGWSRIDQREHDLSDVLFGAVLGFVIGKTVGANHHDQDTPRKWDIQPFADPQNGTNGLTLETRF